MVVVRDVPPASVNGPVVDPTPIALPASLVLAVPVGLMTRPMGLEHIDRYID